MLVNNAGFGDFGRFATAPESRLDDMIELNIGALTRLARAFQPGPLMAVYYATKAYVLSLSEALAEETRRLVHRMQDVKP